MEGETDETGERGRRRGGGEWIDGGEEEKKEKTHNSDLVS